MHGGEVFSPCSGVLETLGTPCAVSQWRSLSKLGPVDAGLLIGFALSFPLPGWFLRGPLKGRVLGDVWVGFMNCDLHSSMF